MGVRGPLTVNHAHEGFSRGSAAGNSARARAAALGCGLRAGAARRPRRGSRHGLAQQGCVLAGAALAPHLMWRSAVVQVLLRHGDGRLFALKPQAGARRKACLLTRSAVLCPAHGCPRRSFPWTQHPYEVPASGRGLCSLIVVCNLLAVVLASTASITAEFEDIEKATRCALMDGSGPQLLSPAGRMERATSWQYRVPPTAARRLRAGWGRSSGVTRSHCGKSRPGAASVAHQWSIARAHSLNALV